jgi:hypothetical protein
MKMNYKNKLKHLPQFKGSNRAIKRLLVVVLISFLVNISTYAKIGPFLDIIGASSICPEVQYYYTFDYIGRGDGCSGGAATWTVTGGSIIGSSTSYGVNVVWNLNATSRSLGVTVEVVGTMCIKNKEIDNHSVTSKIPNVLPVVTAAPTFSLGTNNLCPDDMVSLTIPGTVDATLQYVWQRKIGSGAWATFTTTNGLSASYTVPRVSSTIFPVDLQFRTYTRYKACTNIRSTGYSGTVSGFINPPRPVINFGTNSPPTCPGGGDGSIPITINGEDTQYEFTICRTVPSGDPVICYNWVSVVRSVSDWFNVVYDIDNTIDALQQTNGVDGATLKLSIKSGDYTIYVEPHSATSLCGADFNTNVLPALPLSTSAVPKKNLTCIGGSDGEIEVTTSYGLGPYSYEANTGPNFLGTSYTSTSNIIGGLPLGTYYIRVTDACAQTADYGGATPIGVGIIDPMNGFSISTATGLDIQCTTEVISTGSATVTVQKASGNIVYELLNSGGSAAETSAATTNTTHVFSTSHPTGNYTVRATDGNGCNAVPVPVVIDQPVALDLAYTSIDILCKGAGNGSITITGSGGSGNYEYSINGGTNWQVSGSFPSLLPASAYSLAVRDADVNNPYPVCNYTLAPDVEITEPTTSVSIDSVRVTQTIDCHYDSTGGFRVFVTGGTGGYTFVLQEGISPAVIGTGPSSFEFTGRYAANYTITVYDGAGTTFGCTTSTTFELTEPPLLGIATATPKVYIGGNHISCNGLNDGEITVTTQGGTYPHDVAIDGAVKTITTPGGSVLYTGLSAGTYTILVDDANLCPYSEDITLTEPAILQLDQTTLLTYAGGWNISCKDATDGEVTVTTLGGILPHTVTVNGMNQEINTITPSVTFTNLPVGNYTVALTDANGCTDSRAITLTEPDLFEVTTIDIPSYFGGNHVKCNGDGDATTTISTIGGTYPHQVTANGVTEQINSTLESASFINLGAGTYPVNIVDANFCTNTSSFTVTEPDVLQLDNTATVIMQPLCFGDKTASMTLQAQGGVMIAGTHYHYEIDHQNVPPDLPFVFPVHQELDGINVTFNSLIAGEYLVSVYDHFGCMYQETIQMTTVNQLVIDVQNTDITCKGEANGTATITMTGGTAPYTVIWQNALREAIETDVVNSGEAALLENQGEGLYYLRIIDDSGCEYYQAGLNFSIEGPAQALTLTTNKGDITCYGDNNGLVQLQATGGWQEQPYVFGTDKSNLGINKTFYENLTPGTYRYYVRDSRGCIDSLDVTIIEPALLTLSTSSVTMISCFGGSDGNIILSPQGGRPPYAYTIDGTNYQAIPDFNNLTQGNYTLQVQDSSGCMASTTVTLTEPSPLQASVTNIINTICGENGGSAAAQVSGGTAPYTYRWHDSGNTLLSTTENIATLFSGSYYLEVEDNQGCIETVAFEIINTNDIIIEVSMITPVSCYGGNDGAIDITIVESTPPITISWSNGAGTEDITGLLAGTYTITVSDLVGCEVTETITITSPEPLSITTAINQSPTCYAGCDGAITVAGTGGVAPYTYKWIEDGEATSSITNKCAGTYTVEVTDANGCVYQAPITIEETAPIEIGLGGSSTICEGQAVALDAGAWASYEWRLDTLFSTSRTVTLMQGGVYSLTVTDTDGCEGSESFEVIISNDLLNADFLMASEGIVGDTIVCIDVSWPLVDQISWQYEKTAFTTVREEGAYKELKLLKAGTYSVMMSATLGGCYDEQSYEIVVAQASGRQSEDNGLGHQKTGIKEYTIYPNPSSGIFRADIELYEVGEIKLMMLNLVGSQSVYEYKGQGESSYQINVELSTLPQGVYLLSLETAQETKVLRVFVE